MKVSFWVFAALVSCAPAFSADRLPTVFFSHFYVALDQATFNAIRDSPVISDLAGSEVRHTVSGSRSWDGFYLYGRQTYMEFLVADTLANGDIKEDCGIGLFVEAAGGVDAIANRLRTGFHDKAQTMNRVRATSAGDIPWFRLAAVDTDGPESIGMWVMEIDPKYLETVHPDSIVPHPLSRQAFLSWNFLSSHWLDEVVSIKGALGSIDTKNLAAELELIGWAVHREGGGFRAAGPDVKLEVTPSESRVGIQEVDLRLLRSVPKQTIGLSSAKLVLDGKTGRLIFGTQE